MASLEPFQEKPFTSALPTRQARTAVSAACRWMVERPVIGLLLAASAVCLVALAVVVLDQVFVNYVGWLNEGRSAR